MFSRKQIFLITLILISNFIGFSQTIKVMTYNIRYDNPNDGNNRWDNRKELIINQINEIKPDVIGTQEGLSNQIAFLSQELKNYSFVGIGREDGKEKGEFAAIFYRNDKFKVIADSTFWLSSLPEKPSIGWDAALERICTFALLEDLKSKKRVWVLNTHFDHIGKVARRESSDLILAKIDQLTRENGYPVILTGDFNATETDEPIVVLKTKMFDTFNLLKGKNNKPQATFNGFKVNEPPKERIDYIFVNRKKAKVESHETFNALVDNRYPSDHFPVVAVIRFK